MNYVIISLIACWCMAMGIRAEQVYAPTSNTKKETTRTKRGRKKTVAFQYHNEPLVDIGNQLAKEQGVSMLFPSGAEAISQVATLDLNYPVTLPDAWNIYATLLDVSGYSLIKKLDLYTIVKNNKEIAREPLPVYIGTPWHEIPDSDQRIRYLAYLSNIHVTDTADNLVMVMLKELLSADAKYQTDETSNALIITDKACNVRSVMRIISSLDQTNMQEDFYFLTLRYTRSDIVASLFSDNILKTGDQQQPRYNLQRGKSSMGTYFPENIRVIDYSRTNSLILLGKMSAIERVRDFIVKYIDVELDQGSSILHVKKLQYVRAEDVVPVLENIVKSMRSEGPQQVRGGTQSGGIHRSFEGVIIRSDKPEGDTEGKHAGDNNLIIAATQSDWKELDKLIDQLDKPQRQVIIELLIADLTISDTRMLGSIIRNPQTIPIYDSVNAQAANLNQIVIDSSNKLNSDLLATIFPNPSGSGPNVSAASLLTPGTTVVEFNDATTGATWGLSAISKLFTHSKVLQSPHVIATNNQKTLITIGTSRLVNDAASGSTGGTTTATRKRVDANLKVIVTPRISSADTVNLNVEIHIDDFETGVISDANTIYRHVVTNANVASGKILALGGLTRVDAAQAINKTPLLEKIPLIGWLFKSRSDAITRLNLTVFISPIIIEPRLRAGVGSYTNDYIDLAKRYSAEGMLFGSLKDPITRWFFAPHEYEHSVGTIDTFVAKDEFKQTKKLELTHNNPQSISKNLAEDMYAASCVPCPDSIKKQQELTAQEEKLASLVQDIGSPFEPQSEAGVTQDTTS